MAEILQLAGAQYITVPPTLLKALAAEPYNAANFVNTSLFDVLFDVSIPSPDDFPGLLDEDGSVFNAMVEDEDDGKMQQVWMGSQSTGGVGGGLALINDRHSIYSSRCRTGSSNWWRKICARRPDGTIDREMYPPD